jgi:hypothetical protein
MFFAAIEKTQNYLLHTQNARGRNRECLVFISEEEREHAIKLGEKAIPE